MDMKKIGLGLGGFAAGVAAWTFAVGRYGERATRFFADLPPITPRPRDADADATPAPAAPAATGGTAEHVPTDLAPGATVSPATRAPDAFRPDPTAVPTAEERESLRPATGHAPGFAADRGSTID